MTAIAKSVDDAKKPKVAFTPPNLLPPSPPPPKQMVFTADADAQEMIESLKSELGATTIAGVLRKALAIARLAADQGKEDGGIVLIRGRNQPDHDGVLISLKT